MVRKTYSFQKEGNLNDVYTIENSQGAKVEVLTYGARLIRIFMPDKDGQMDDVLVGCKTPEAYYNENPYFGATIGRYANRIGGAVFTLNGKTYQVEANEKANSLHGGSSTNFDRQIWDAQIIDENTLALFHISPDGAGGYPGELKVQVSFTLTDDNRLMINYLAYSTKDTVCNLTNHAYFNIGGQKSATVLNQELMINSLQITPVDEQLIPHGKFMDIEGTPYSFYKPKLIGKDIFADASLIRQCNGFDFNYCLKRKTEKNLEHFAYVYDKASGRRMDCYTTLPGVQLYTACSTGGFKGKQDYVNYCALCLETQNFPNAPNCPSYPSTLLKAGELYESETVYAFSVVND